MVERLTRLDASFLHLEEPGTPMHVGGVLILERPPGGVEALERFAGRQVRFFLPADRRATDAALAAGRTLAEVAGASPLRAELRALAAALAGVPVPAGRRRGIRRQAASR